MYIEPYVPVPQVVIVGRSPAVHVFDDPGMPCSSGTSSSSTTEGSTPTIRIRSSARTALDFAHLGIGSASAIVVVTQGHYDELALERALATHAAYIGVVAAENEESSPGLLLGALA